MLILLSNAHAGSAAAVVHCAEGFHASSEHT